MEAPSPITMDETETERYEQKDNIIGKKEYELEMNNNKYNLRIFIDSKYISFKLSPINDIMFIYYMNKFDLNGINDKLGVNYKNLEKIMKLIDSCYNNNKLLLKYNRDNEINIIMRYIIGYDEEEYQIRLIKKKLHVNEKFEVLLNEIILMKKDKNSKIKENGKKIEKLIIDIKDNLNKKLEENINIINILKKKIEENKISLEITRR